MTGLPGAEIVQEGLAALAEGRETLSALLVAMAATRLRRLGLPTPMNPPQAPELRLYRALCAEDPATAYGRYNSLRRRLDSFAAALEREQGKILRSQR